ncbi:MAG: hypothetical protein SGARI_001920, partial [Bacillariaceae sp.]
MSSAVLVNVSAEAEVHLVGLLSKTSSSGGFKLDCESSIASGDASKLIRTIVNDEGSMKGLVAAPTEEGVSAISLIAALLEKVKDGSSSQLLKELADAIVRSGSGDSSSAVQEITLLATLYNMRTDPSEKIALLVRMIQLASSRDPSLLEPNTSVLGKWMDSSRLSAMLDEWNVAPAGRRELYRAAAEGAQNALSKQQFTLLVVETYAKSDFDAIGVEYAKKAAIGAIQDPVSLFVQQRNIMSLPAVQALSQSDGTFFLDDTQALFFFVVETRLIEQLLYSPVAGVATVDNVQRIISSKCAHVWFFCTLYPSLLALLKVFQEGKLEDYNGFIQSNGGDSVLTQWNLSSDECIRFMRILSLCSLAAEQEEIPYALIASDLKCNENEVEQQVIAAVSSGLVSCKMDQLSQTVTVNSSVNRSVDMKDW